VTSAARPTVVLHAADPVVEAGVVSLLEHRHDAARLCEGNEPGNVQLVVVDRLDPAGLRVLRSTRSFHSAPIMLISALLDEEELQIAAEHGVLGFLRRAEVTGNRLVEVVRTTARSEATIPADLQEYLLKQLRRPQASSPPLTAREVDILKLLSEGLDTVGIAQKLAYSERTVKNVVFHVTQRFGLNNRAHAVAFALRQGLI
jgi:DNA-binding NarL/FixJ family response regulator